MRASLSCHLALALLFASAFSARAATRTWTNPVNGVAGTASNWTPAIVPGSLDTCAYSLNAAYQVTFGNQVPTTAAQLATLGDLTLRILVPHTTQRLYVGRVAAQACSVSISEGALSLSNGGYVGIAGGTTGVLKLTGPAASLDMGPAPFTVGDDGGTGTFVVSNGASSTSSFGIRLGWDTGIGTIRVTGVSSSDPNQRSSLTTTGTFYNYFGNFGGTGRLEVTNGALADFSHDIYLGIDSISTGSIYVGGAGTADSARVLLGTHLGIGTNASANRAGTGSLTVEAGGVVEASGTITTYDENGGGGSGTIALRPGGRIITTGLVLDDPANDLIFSGGRLQINHGGLTTNGHALSFNGKSDTPILELLGGAGCTLNSSTSPTLCVAEGGPAELHVSGGSDLTVHDHNAIVGDNTGSEGTLEIRDTGSSLTVDQVTLVGRAGEGTLTIRDGADATLNQLGVATQSTGSGTVSLDEPGSTLHVTDDFEVGGLSTGASNGPGVVVVSDDAQLWLDRTGIIGNLWPTSALFLLRGGEVHMTGLLNCRGQVALTDGSIQGGAINLLSPGAISGYGDVNAAVGAVFDSSTTIDAGGTLLLGTSSSPVGFQYPGTLDVASHAVTLRDADSAVVGTVLLDGGTLTGPAGGVDVPFNRAISGTGTINGPIRPIGRIIATGTSGISFGGFVLGTGQGVNGSKFRFLSGGGFLGGGLIEASVQVDSGGVVAPNAALTVGSFPAISTFGVDGTLGVGPGATVSCDVTDTTRVNGAVVLSGGTVIPLHAPLLIRTAGRISGFGSIVGSAVISGTLDPGTGARRISLTTAQMTGTAHVAFDMGDLHAGVKDTIAASGTVQVAGTLDLRTLSGYTTNAGDSVLVLSGSSVTGAFSAVTINGVPATNQVQLVYKPTGVWVKITGSTAVSQPAATVAGAPLRFAPLRSPAEALVFALDLPEAAEVSVELFDVNGRRVATLARGALAAGRHTLDVNRSAASSPGLYFGRATVRMDGRTSTLTARAVRVR